MNYNWKVLALVGFLSGATTLAGYKFFIQDDAKEVILKEASDQPLARFTSGGVIAPGPIDFTVAAETSTPVVVHIKSTSMRQQSAQRPVLLLTCLTFSAMAWEVLSRPREGRKVRGPA